MSLSEGGLAYQQKYWFYDPVLNKIIGKDSSLIISKRFTCDALIKFAGEDEKERNQKDPYFGKFRLLFFSESVDEKFIDQISEIWKNRLDVTSLKQIPAKKT